MDNTFNQMFYPNVDETERGKEPIDTITVRLEHAWNWDALMEQCVIYSFIKYWENDGEGMMKVYSGDEKESCFRHRRWVYKGLNICYKRIMSNKEIFFGDPVENDVKIRYKTLEFIWKYHRLMWN